MEDRNSLTRRRFLRVSAATATSLVLAACGASPATTPAPAGDAPVTNAPGGTAAADAPLAPAAGPGEQIQLSVWHNRENELEPVIALFEQRYPNVTINFQYYPSGDFFDKLNTAYAAGSPPDVHRQDDDEIPFFVQRNVLLPLDSYIESTVNRDDVYWNIIESTRVNDQLWVAVAGSRVSALLYNKTLFDEAGVPYPPADFPSEDWTWDDFAETARRLSRPDEQIYGVAGITHRDFVVSMGRSNGGDLISENCGEFLMNQAPMVEAMQKIADLMHVDRAAADPETEEAFGGWQEMFNAGRAAMVYLPTRPLPPDDVSFEWDITGLPVFPGQQPSIWAGIDSYAVPRATKHPEMATAFAAFLMSEEAQRSMAETRGIIPMHKEAAETIWVPATSANRQLLLDAAPYGRTFPFAVGFGRVQDIAWPMIGEVLLGQKTAQQAMDEAKPLADAVLQEAGGCLGA